MINVRAHAIVALGILLVASSLYAGDLSKYREFQLDSNLLGLAKEAGMKPADAKVIHQRPAVIQELSWRAEPGDSVKEIVFGFYNGELFRMVAGYDRHKTAGLTARDMIEAISATYGKAADPAAEIILPSMYDDRESVKVLARWEDVDWSFNLVRSKYEPSFTLFAFSKQLDAQARSAIAESLRLDRLEAPRRAIERRSREDEESRLTQEKARQANRPEFRP